MDVRWWKMIRIVALHRNCFAFGREHTVCKYRRLYLVLGQWFLSFSQACALTCNYVRTWSHMNWYAMFVQFGCQWYRTFYPCNRRWMRWTCAFGSRDWSSMEWRTHVPYEMENPGSFHTRPILENGTQHPGFLVPCWTLHPKKERWGFYYIQLHFLWVQ